MTSASQRDAKLDRDVAKRKLLEADQLERFSLFLRQTRQTRADHPSTLVAREASPLVCGICGKLVERCASVCRAGLERRLPSKRTVVGVLKQPDADRTARGVVLTGLAEHFEKDLLRDVLRLSGVAQNVRRDTVNEA